MTRVSPRLLFLLGTLMLALWFASPLSSSPTARSLSPAPPPLPELDEVIREVDRLELRLAQPIRPTAPDRDPFRFAPGPVATGDAAAAAADLATPMPAPAPPVAWPTLVGILSTGTVDAPAHRVVFEDSARLVHIRTAGDVFGDITVSAVDDDQVTLVHASSGRSTTLRLR